MNASLARWPAFIISLVIAFIAITWWSLTRAASEVSPVTDVDYYRHGLRYSHSHPLGGADKGPEWTVSQELAGRLLTIRVADSHQNGVSGCTGALTFPATTAAHGATPLTMTEAGEGIYTAEFPATLLRKTIIADLTLSKGEAAMERRLLLTLTP